MVKVICKLKLITSVEEERAKVSAIVHMLLCGFFSQGFPLPLDAWDMLRFFLWHSIGLPYNYNYANQQDY